MRRVNRQKRIWSRTRERRQHRRPGAVAQVNRSETGPALPDGTRRRARRASLPGFTSSQSASVKHESCRRLVGRVRRSNDLETKRLVDAPPWWWPGSPSSRLGLAGAAPQARKDLQEPRWGGRRWRLAERARRHRSRRVNHAGPRVEVARRGSESAVPSARRLVDCTNHS